MDAETEGFHFDHPEIVLRSALEALDIPRRKAEFDARRQPHDDTVATGIVMRTLGTRPMQPGLSPRLGCRKFLLCQLSHGNASMRPSTRPNGPRSAAGPGALPARYSRSPL